MSSLRTCLLSLTIIMLATACSSPVKTKVALPSHGIPRGTVGLYTDASTFIIGAVVSQLLKTACGKNSQASYVDAHLEATIVESLESLLTQKGFSVVRIDDTDISSVNYRYDYNTRAVCKKLIEYVQSKNFDYVIHLHSFFELHTLEQVRYGDFNYYGDFNMTTFLEWLEPRTGQVVYDKEVGISTISRGAKVKYDMPSCRVNLTSLRQVSAPLLQYTISAFEQDLQSL